MKKWLSAIFLLLTAVTAFADGSSSHHLITSFTQGVDAITNGTDMSISYLSQLFGNIGAGILPGSSGNIFGTLMYRFNMGMLVVVGVAVVWSVGNIGMELVLGDERMNGRKSFMTVLKICLAVSCLIPNVTGYTVLQQIMAEIVVQGVGLADQIWVYTLDYFDQGGLVYFPPENTSSTTDGTTQLYTQEEVKQLLAEKEVDTSKGDTTSVNSEEYTPTQNMMASYVCMYMADALGDGATLHPAIEMVSSSSDTRAEAKATFPSEHSSSGCGKYTLIANPNHTHTGDISNVFYNALYMFVNDLKTPSRNVFCALHPGLGTCPKTPETTIVEDQNDLNIAILDYVNYMQQVSQYLKMHTYDDGHEAQDDQEHTVDDGGVGEANQMMLKQAAANGWMSAGAYIWDISELSYSQSITYHVNHQTCIWGMACWDNYTDDQEVSASAAIDMESTWVVPQCTGSDCPSGLSNVPYMDSNGQDWQDDMTQAMNRTYCYTQTEGWDDGGVCQAIFNVSDPDAAASYRDTSVMGVFSAVNETFENGTDSSGNATSNLKHAKSAVGSVGGWFSSIFLGEVKSAYQNLEHDFKNIDKSYGFNPLGVLHMIGQHCLLAAVALWMMPLPWLLGIAFAGMFCHASEDLNSVLQIIVESIKPLIMALALPLLGAGFFLSYYVPFYPFLIFTLAVIGWLMAVIESMVAAPLVCLGLTHPAGHDLTSDLKQAMMLTLTIFLRPALLVIGTMMSVLVMMIGYRFLIQTFSAFMFDLFDYPLRGDATNGSTGAIGSHGIWSGVHHVTNEKYGPGNFNMKLDTGGAWAKLNKSIGQLVGIPCILVIFTMACVSVCQQAAGLITGLADYVGKWIGAPEFRSPGGSPAELAQGIKGATQSAGKALGEAVQGTAQAAGEGVKGVSDAIQEKKEKAMKAGADVATGGATAAGDAGGSK